MISKVAVRAGAIVAVAAMVGGATASSASAVAWGILDSYYNGTKRVQAKGDWIKHAGTYARNDIILADPANDGNNVLVNTSFKWRKDGAWAAGGSLATKEYDFFSTPVATWVQKPLDGEASKARAVIKACAQMGWPVPDSCSDAAVVTFSY